MTSESCRRYRADIGGLVLGHLQGSARAALVAHLEGCAACRQEADDLVAVARALPAADHTRLGVRAAPPRGVLDKILGQVRVLRARRRRRTITRVAAGLAAAAALVVAGVLVPRGSQSERVAFAPLPPGVQASATIEARDWGMQIELDATGLPAHGIYAVWCEREDGTRVTAGTFYVPVGRRVHAILGSALAYRHWSAVDITTPDGKTVMRSVAQG